MRTRCNDKAKGRNPQPQFHLAAKSVLPAWFNVLMPAWQID
jgi:hypothetical protein